ncbi:50S ribosomal protein L23 [archaeon]|nr:50S ribosomal protein L23 [archaeon]
MRPVLTEKAVMMIETSNTLTFETGMRETKEQIKNEIKELFEVEVEKIRTLIKNNKKYVYVKLKGDTLAIDIATKLGLM